MICDRLRDDLIPTSPSSDSTPDVDADAEASAEERLMVRLRDPAIPELGAAADPEEPEESRICAAPPSPRGDPDPPDGGVASRRPDVGFWESHSAVTVGLCINGEGRDAEKEDRLVGEESEVEPWVWVNKGPPAGENRGPEPLPRVACVVP